MCLYKGRQKITSAVFPSGIKSYFLPIDKSISVSGTIGRMETVHVYIVQCTREDTLAINE